MLNIFFDVMVAEVESRHGIVNQFVGDGFMAIFGAIDDENEGHEDNAVAAGRGMLEALPKVAAEMAKPAEKIDSIKIHQISGMNTSGSGGNENKSPLTQAMESLLGIAVQLPAMKQIGKELGVEFDDESLKEVSRTVNRSSAKGKSES